MDLETFVTTANIGDEFTFTTRMAETYTVLKTDYGFAVVCPDDTGDPAVADRVNYRLNEHYATLAR
jgi:hypothetical protein